MPDIVDIIAKLEMKKLFMSRKTGCLFHIVI